MWRCVGGHPRWLSPCRAGLCEPEGPAEVISDVTAQVMTVVAEANTYFDEDPDRYYREIDNALAELVDWRGFATAVMGEYYSRGRSMDQAGRANLKRQRDDFAKNLREGLIRSYAKGLLAFGGARMEVQGSRPHRRARASLPSRSWCMARRSGCTPSATRWVSTKMVLGACEISLSRPLILVRSTAISLVRWPEMPMTTRYSVIAQWNEAVIEQAEELTGD